MSSVIYDFQQKIDDFYFPNEESLLIHHFRHHQYHHLNFLALNFVLVFYQRNGRSLYDLVFLVLPFCYEKHLLHLLFQMVSSLNSINNFKAKQEAYFPLSLNPPCPYYG